MKRKGFTLVEMIMVIILSIFMVVTGCAQMAKIEKKTYDEGMKYSLGTMKAWSYYSGFYTCGMGGTQVVFPVTVKNAADLQAILQNPVVLTGIAQLDDLARKTNDPTTNLPFWKDYDWTLGCSSGLKGRMTVSEVINIIKVAYPASAQWLPSFGQ